MGNPSPRPDTINALRFGVDSAFAMLAGMQLDVFSPLQHGPMTAGQNSHGRGRLQGFLPGITEGWEDLEAAAEAEGLI